MIFDTGDCNLSANVVTQYKIKTHKGPVFRIYSHNTDCDPHASPSPS